MFEISELGHAVKKSIYNDKVPEFKNAAVNCPRKNQEK